MIINAERMTEEARKAAEEREAQFYAMVESRREHFGPGSASAGGMATAAGTNVLTLTLCDVERFRPEKGDRMRWGLVYVGRRRPGEYEEDEEVEIQVDLEKGLARERRAFCSPERWTEWADARRYLCRYRSDGEILAAAKLVAAGEDSPWGVPLQPYLGEGYEDEWQPDDVRLVCMAAEELIRA